MEAKVKRCPFCNSHRLTMDLNALVRWLKCLECGACGPLAGKSASDAVMYWNGDHPHQNPSALVADRASNRDDLKTIQL